MLSYFWTYTPLHSPIRMNCNQYHPAQTPLISAKQSHSHFSLFVDNSGQLFIFGSPSQATILEFSVVSLVSSFLSESSSQKLICLLFVANITNITNLLAISSNISGDLLANWSKIEQRTLGWVLLYSVVVRCGEASCMNFKDKEFAN